MALIPATREAYDLLLQGAIAFAALQRAGLRIDVPYLDKAIADTKQQVKDMREELNADPIMDEWQKLYGQNTKINSPVQLGHVMFDCLGYKRNPLFREIKDDGEEKDSNEEAAFKHIKIPFIKIYFESRKLDKAAGTFLMGTKREVVNGFVHPFENLHTTESYRPSCQEPNYANQPTRNKTIAKIVRSAVISRFGDDGVLLEADFESHEVKTSCFYHKDENFIRYVTGGGDMHYDTAKTVYLLNDSEIEGKDTRYAAKNKFVFPGFYGAYYITMTPDLWDAMDELNLVTAQGVPMQQHLRSKGIKSRGLCDPTQEPVSSTFEAHVRKCQEIFWARFPTYVKWKEDWWQQYQRNGGFHLLSGFTNKGIFRRNQVLCDANQGTAFHCLLWSLIRVRWEMLRKKMRSKCILQIYDSQLFDCHKSEVDDVIELVRRISTQEVARAWKWITVPLSIEFQVCTGSWWNKTKIKT